MEDRRGTTPTPLLAHQRATLAIREGTVSAVPSTPSAIADIQAPLGVVCQTPVYDVTMSPLATVTRTTLSMTMMSPTAISTNCFLRWNFFSGGISSRAPVRCWMP